MQTQSPRLSNAVAAGGAHDELTAFLLSGGADLGVSFGPSHVADGGLGLRARVPLDLGDCAVRVPRALQFREDNVEWLSEMARGTAVAARAALTAAAALKGEGLGVDGAVLACALLAEADGSTTSHFAPLLGTLPGASEQDAAWLWSPDERRALLSPALSRAASLLAARVRREFHAVKHLLGDSLRHPAFVGDAGDSLDSALEARFRWARSVVITHAHDVNGVVAILPGIHLANHADDFAFGWGAWADDADGAAALLCDRPVDAGGEVFNSYGRRENADLLLWYGFTCARRTDVAPVAIENGSPPSAADGDASGPSSSSRVVVARLRVNGPLERGIDEELGTDEEEGNKEEEGHEGEEEDELLGPVDETYHGDIPESLLALARAASAGAAPDCTAISARDWLLRTARAGVSAAAARREAIDALLLEDADPQTQRRRRLARSLVETEAAGFEQLATSATRMGRL